MSQVTTNRAGGRPRSGQLIWRKSGWVARLTVEIDGERVRVCRALGTDNKAVARRKLARLLESEDASAAPRLSRKPLAASLRIKVPRAIEPGRTA
jgi:hypothetical protein